MHKNNFAEFGEDQELIASCDRGRNTKETEARKVVLLNRMIETLKEVKESWVLPLLELVNCQYLQAKGDFISKDYVLFDYLAGEKTVEKRALMNRILTLCGVKWKNVGNHKSSNRILQPGTHLKMIRTLLVKLRERNINYNHKEFNDIGEFSGVVASLWQSRQKNDASYGCPKKKRVDPKFVRLLVESVVNKTFQPLTNPKHMLFALIFCNGYYCAFRGGEDHWSLRMSDVTSHVFTIEHGEEWAGHSYMRVNISASKATRLSVNHPSVKPNQQTSLIVPSEVEVDGWNPPDIYKKYMSKCHPDAQTFYCRYIDSESTRKKFNQELKNRDVEWNQNNPTKPRNMKEYDVWFFPSGNGVTNHNIGSKTITNYCKELAKLIGLDEFQSCTGHALRALNCTNAQEGGLNCNDIANMARQSNIHVQKEYIDGLTATRERNQLNAILVGNVCARTSIGRSLLKNPTKKKTIPILPQKRSVEKEEEEEILLDDIHETEESLRIRNLALENELNIWKSRVLNNPQLYNERNIQGPPPQLHPTWNMHGPSHMHGHQSLQTPIQHHPGYCNHHCPQCNPTYNSYYHDSYRYDRHPPPPHASHGGYGYTSFRNNQGPHGYHQFQEPRQGNYPWNQRPW